MRVLGIEGGGASTKVSEVTAAGLNRKIYPLGMNPAAAGSEAERLIGMLQKEFGPVDAIACACSGADSGERKEALTALLHNRFPQAILRVMSDAEGTYRACLGSRPGVVVIAGTGSIVYGKDAAGRSHRAGGWGCVFDDEGGAFWIGKELVKEALRWRDGLAPYDPIFDALLAHFKVRRIEDLVDLQSDSGFRARIASAARIALEAPTDLVMNVVDRGTDLLAKRTLKVVEKVGPVDTVHVYGGNFQSRIYRTSFTRHLRGLRVSLFRGRVDEELAVQLYAELMKGV